MKCEPTNSTYVAPSMRSAAVAMSRLPARMSHFAATNAVGTLIELSETRPWREVVRARWKYQSTGVDRNSRTARSEEHTSELQSLMRISYAVFCLKKKTITN